MEDGPIVRANLLGGDLQIAQEPAIYESGRNQTGRPSKRSVPV